MDRLEDLSALPPEFRAWVLQQLAPEALEQAAQDGSVPSVVYSRPISGTEALRATTLRDAGIEIPKASPRRVHEFLVNLEELVKIVPGLVKSERTSDDTVKTTVGPGVSFIRSQVNPVMCQGVWMSCFPRCSE